MIFLWIFLAVLFLILALLLTPIHLIFQYPAKSNVSFRIFCFRFDGAELFKKIFLKDEELSEEYIIPEAFDKRVGEAVAKAVGDAAKRTGVARVI